MIDLQSFLWGVAATMAAGAFVAVLVALFTNPRALAVKRGK